MANTINEDGALLVSKLNMNGTTYTLKDAWARAEIAEIEQAIGGGVHFRGVSTTAIADKDNVKDLTVNSATYAAADQETGDIFIYNDGKNNLEFIVVNGKYSELGSTGQLGALAFANTATGTTTVNVSGAITFNTYTPDVGKGTLSVTYETGNLSVSSTATAASVTADYSPAAVTFAAEACEITTAATAATAEVKFSPAAITVADATCTVTTAETAAAAAATFSPADITVTAKALDLTTTGGTFTALKNVTYDSESATLTISDGTSDSFLKTVGGTAPGQTVTQTANQTVSVAVTYDKVSAVTAPGQTVTQDANQTATVSVTYDKVTAVTAPSQTISQDANQKLTIAVTYDKVSASGTFLTTASLDGDLLVTGAKPTAVITNPEISVTVSPAGV